MTMADLTEALDVIRANLVFTDRRAPHGIVFAFSNVRPFIEPLRDAGFLEPWDAMRQEGGETTARLLGKTLPMMTLVGSYKLTEAGRAAIEGRT